MIQAKQRYGPVWKLSYEQVAANTLCESLNWGQNLNPSWLNISGGYTNYSAYFIADVIASFIECQAVEFRPSSGKITPLFQYWTYMDSWLYNQITCSKAVYFNSVSKYVCFVSHPIHPSHPKFFRSKDSSVLELLKEALDEVLIHPYVKIMMSTQDFHKPHPSKRLFLITGGSICKKVSDEMTIGEVAP